MKPPRAADLTCSIIKALGDKFDMLAYYSDFCIDNPEAGTSSTGPLGVGPAGGAVTGIGANQRNLASYCTAGRLKWQFIQPVYVGVNKMQEYPPEGLSETNTRNIRGLYAPTRRTDGQRGNSFVRLCDVADWSRDGPPLVRFRLCQSQRRDNPAWSHALARGLQAPVAFPYERPTKASAMGGGVWQDNFDGTFTQVDDDYYVPATGWSYLDLYLMCMISPAEVADFFILRNLIPTGHDSNGHVIFRADRTKVTIQGVIAVEVHMAHRGQHGTVFVTGSRTKQWAGRSRVYFRDVASGEEKFTQKSVSLGKKSELTKFQAQERLRAIIDREINERKKAPLDPRVTFRWYVEKRYLVNHCGTWRPATLHSTTAELRSYILPEFGELPIGEIERNDCSRFLEKLVSRFSRVVVIHAKVTTKAISEDAIEDGYISRNPLRKVKTPITRKPKKHVLEAGQARQFFAKITNSKHLALMTDRAEKPVMTPQQILGLLKAIEDIQDLCLIYVAIFCGLRAGEAVALQWKSWTGTGLLPYGTAYEGQFYKDRFKTKSSRNPIPVPEQVRPVIDLWQRVCKDPSPEALMFPTFGRGNRKGEAIPREAKNFLNCRIRPIARKLGIPDHLITFQVMRRTMGTDMQHYGTFKDTQGALRHASITTTGDVYTQTIDENVARAVNARAIAVLNGWRVPIENLELKGAIFGTCLSKGSSYLPSKLVDPAIEK
jgi:integrase